MVWECVKKSEEFLLSMLIRVDSRMAWFTNRQICITRCHGAMASLPLSICITHNMRMYYNIKHDMFTAFCTDAYRHSAGERNATRRGGA